MSKTKSKSKKSKTSSAAPPPPDRFDTMSVYDLQDELTKSTARINDLRRNRNYYQLEKDKLQQIYDLAADEVSKTESHIRNLEQQMERLSDTHRNDIRIYLQKVIHLEYEHENNLHHLASKSAQESKTELDEHHTYQSQLKDRKTQLKSQLKKQELANEEEIAKLKDIERKEMMKLKEQFERNYQEMITNYKSRVEQLKEDLELRKKMEIHEIEERKNRHINDLILNHHSNFNEMRNYYNAITQDNLDLIKELNHEIEELKLTHQENEKNMEQMEKKNDTLSEPLSIAEAKVKNLQHKLLNYSKDSQSLKHASNRLIQLELSYKNLCENYINKQYSYNQLVKDKQIMLNEFQTTVGAATKNSAEKNEELGKILESYGDAFDLKKTQFTAVLRASNLDPVVLQNVTSKLDDVLTSKNQQIEELKYGISKMKKGYNELVRVYEAKLLELGIPKQEAKLAERLVGDVGTAPADLIVQ